jgi:membrane protein
MAQQQARRLRRPVLADLRTLAERALKDFFADRAPQLAAAVSYYVLFAVFPLAIVVVATAGLVLDEQTVREQVIDQVVRRLGLVGANASELAELMQETLTGLGALGLLGLAGLIWTASGVMTSLRNAVNTAFDVEDRRPILRGKLLDVGFVFLMAPLFAASLAVTFLVRLAGAGAAAAGDWLGPAEVLAGVGLEVVSVVVAIAFSFVIVVLVYRWVPARRMALSEVWVGALIAAVLLEFAKSALALYFRYFGNYDAIYGSLGAVISFMFFVFVAANIVLLGAEAASEWPRVRAGSYDGGSDRDGGPGLRRRILRELVGVAGDGRREQRNGRVRQQRARRSSRTPAAPIAPAGGRSIRRHRRPPLRAGPVG